MVSEAATTAVVSVWLLGRRWRRSDPFKGVERTSGSLRGVHTHHIIGSGGGRASRVPATTCHCLSLLAAAAAACHSATASRGQRVTYTKHNYAAAAWATLVYIHTDCICIYLGVGVQVADVIYIIHSPTSVYVEIETSLMACNWIIHGATFAQSPTDSRVAGPRYPRRQWLLHALWYNNINTYFFLVWALARMYEEAVVMVKGFEMIRRGIFVRFWFVLFFQSWWCTNYTIRTPRIILYEYYLGACDNKPTKYYLHAKATKFEPRECIVGVMVVLCHLWYKDMSLMSFSVLRCTSTTAHRLLLDYRY